MSRFVQIALFLDKELVGRGGQRLGAESYGNLK